MSAAGPIDRELQHALLMKMREVYPDRVREELSTLGERHALLANLAYLREHGLCDVMIHESLGGIDGFAGPVITAAGLDFLADDGGLSAILGVVTVKLHAETIRDLIAAKIEASPMPEKEKAGLRAALAKLPAAALQEGSKRLIGLGIDHVGDVGAWLHDLPGTLGL